MQNKYLSSDTMYRIDQYTIEEIGIPSPVLMERAAYSVFLDLKTKLSKETSILVVAGTGNNGGDAVAIARMLFIEGFNVQCYIIKPENYSEGMTEQVRIAENIDLPITYEFDPIHFEQADWIIEGIFGIGLSREIEGKFKTIIDWINQFQNVKVVSLDIPSGLSAVTGEAFQTVVQADYTYTFGFFKKGMDTEKGQAFCGNIHLCDLGYPTHKLNAFL